MILKKTIFDIDIEKISIISSISIFAVVLSQDDIIYECRFFFPYILNIYDNIILKIWRSYHNLLTKYLRHICVVSDDCFGSNASTFSPIPTIDYIRILIF